MKLCKDCKHFTHDIRSDIKPQCALTIKRHQSFDLVMGKHNEYIISLSCQQTRTGFDYWNRFDPDLCGEDAKHFEQAEHEYDAPIAPHKTILQTIINFFAGRS